MVVGTGCTMEYRAVGLERVAAYIVGFAGVVLGSVAAASPRFPLLLLLRLWLTPIVMSILVGLLGKLSLLLDLLVVLLVVVEAVVRT